MGKIYRGPLAGRANITINGEIWNVVGELTYATSKPINETLKGQSAVEGYSQMPNQGMMSMTLRQRRDKSAFDFQGADSFTIVAELANGVVVTGKEMWQVEQIAINTQEGTFEFKVEGADVSEALVKG